MTNFWVIFGAIFGPFWGLLRLFFGGPKRVSKKGRSKALFGPFFGAFFRAFGAMRWRAARLARAAICRRDARKVGRRVAGVWRPSRNRGCRGGFRAARLARVCAGEREGRGPARGPRFCARFSRVSRARNFAPKVARFLGPQKGCKFRFLLYLILNVPADIRAAKRRDVLRSRRPSAAAGRAGRRSLLRGQRSY